MAADVRVVARDVTFTWDKVPTRLGRGTVLAVPPGSALEAAIGPENLTWPPGAAPPAPPAGEPAGEAGTETGEPGTETEPVPAPGPGTEAAPAGGTVKAAAPLAGKGA